MHKSRRSVHLGAALLGLSLLSCGREVTGPDNGVSLGWSRHSALALAPQFPTLPGANAASDLVPFTQVRVVLRRVDGVIAKDTLIDFPSTDSIVTLTLDIPLPLTAPDSGMTLGLSLAYVNAQGDTVFRGGPLPITAKPAGSPGASNPISIPVSWVPPGNVPPASVTITPATGNVVSGTTTAFTAVARDAQNNVLAGTPVGFSSPDTNRATVTFAGGVATWKPVRGTTLIVATLLNGHADTASFNVSLPPSLLVPVSGNAQSGTINTALAQPLVFRVTASDAVPVSGVPVTFAVTTGGGSLGVLADTSDVNGLVSVSWTLGSLVGAQSVTATATGVAGATSVMTATGLAPLPTQLFITGQPVSGISQQALAPVVVQVRDASNQLTPLFNGSVSIALDAGGTGATVSGTSTVNAVNGVATFSGLTIGLAAPGLRFIVTSAGLTPDTTTAFAISPSAPTTLVSLLGDAQTGTLGQPLTDSLIVELRDSFGNAVAGQTILFNVTTGGGATSPVSMATNGVGRAATRWTLGALVGAQNVVAELNGNPVVNHAFSATGVAGAAARLEITTEPAVGQTAGVPLSPAIVVRAVDAVGATATSFTGNVTLALAANPTATTPSGTLSVSAIAGIATFSNAMVNAAGTGYTFAATSAGLIPDTTQAFIIAPAVAAQLATVSGNAQSGTVTSGLAAPFVVRVTDAFGNGIAGVTVNWAIAAGGGSLGAPTSITNATGDASIFLTLPAAVGTVTTQATVAGLIGSPQSFTSTATAGAAFALVSTQGPTTGVAGVMLAPAAVFEARDQQGNLVPTFTGPVTVVLSDGPGGSTLGGTTTVNAVGGIATFSDLTIDHVATTWDLLASSAGLAQGAVANITITNAAASAIAAVAGNAQTGPALVQLPGQVTFRVTDAFGNRVAGEAVTIAVTTGGGSVGTVGGVTDALGELSTTWTLGGTLGTQSITATVTSAPAAQAVASANATAGAATQLAITTPPPATIVAGVVLPDVIVEARDAAGNRATGFTGVVRALVTTGPSPDSAFATAVAGVATFSGASFDEVGVYTLTFSSAGLTDAVSGTLTVTPAAAATIANESSLTMVGFAGLQIPAAIAVRTEDAFNNRVAGVLVSFVMVRGIDTLGTADIATDSLGIAGWQPVLPQVAGATTVTATAVGLTGSPVTFTVTAFTGPAAELGMGTQPTGGSAGVAIPATTVRANDQFGNLRGDYVANVTAVIDSGPAGGVLSGTTTVAAVAGVSTYNTLSFSTAGTYRLRFSSGALIDTVSSTFVITASAASQLVITSGTIGTQVAGQLVPSVVAEARDAQGNVATAFTGVVTIRIDTGPAGTVGDSMQVAAVAGVATFATIDFETAGTYVLRITAPGLSDALTNSFVVNPGPAAIIAPDTLASGNGQTGAIGTALAQPLRVTVTDSTLNGIAGVAVVFTTRQGVDTLAVDTVTTDASGMATLTPTLPLTAGTVEYVVTSNGLVGSGFILTATATASAATHLVVAQQPANAVAGAQIPATIVQALDAGGNLDASFTGLITVVVDSGPQLGWSMGGTQSLNAVGGVATFGDITLNRVSQYRLRFTSPGLDSTNTTPFLITVGPPASLTIVGGNGQTAAAFAALTDSLEVLLADAAGNAIIGATVNWIVQSGGGSLNAATSLTDTAGIARIAWTLGGTVGAQYVAASGGGFGPISFTANATSTSFNLAWTGAVSTSWNTAGNWSGGVLPTFSDSVLIPAGTPFSVVLDTATLVARLQVDNGATLQLDTFPLLVNGSLDVQAGAAVLSNGISGTMSLIGSGTVRGTLPHLLLQSGAYTLGGALDVQGDLNISGGSLEIGTQAATVGGDFRTIGTGALSMTGAGTLVVQGDAFFSGGATAGLLTSGTLSVRGDFTQGAGSPYSFSADAGHTTVLDGPATQHVTMLNADLNFDTACSLGSCFGNLTSLRAGGTGTLVFQTGVKARGTMQFSGDSLDAPGVTLISTGTPSFASTSTVAGTIAWQTGLVRTANFAVDTLVAWGNGALILGETVPTIVRGPYTVTGAHPAAVVIDGTNGMLDVVGAATIGSGGTALSTRANGRLRMTEPGDTLVVNGDANFDGITAAGMLTDGLLVISGDFAETRAPGIAFLAEGAHTTRFDGANPSVSFATTTNNQFANLQINSGSAFTFTGNGRAVGNVVLGPTTSVVGGSFINIGGDLIDSVGNRWQATETEFDKADPIIPAQVLGSLLFNNGVTFDTNTVIGDRLEARGGIVDLNGHRVEANGGFEASGTGVLRMMSAADTLVVVGTAQFHGTASTAGQMMNGRLELYGNFQQFGNAESFSAGGAHQTWFLGATSQSVSFANGGSGAGTSHFAALGNGQSSGASVTLLSDLWADGMLLVPTGDGGEFAGTGTQRVISRGADVRGVDFNQSGWVLFAGAPVVAIDSARFVGQSATSVQFEIVRDGGTITLGDPSFATVPSGAGRYLRVEDSDGAANGILTINVVNPTPATNGGYVEQVNGALVNGWANFSGLTWSGAVSDVWTDPANWVEGIVPTPTDSVRVPAAGVTNLPSLNQNTVVRALVQENDNPISLSDAATFTISEAAHFRADTAAVSCISGNVEVGAVGAVVTLAGVIACPVQLVASASVTLTGPTRVVGNTLAIIGTQLELGGHPLTVGGVLLTQTTGTIRMALPADSVDVGGAQFDGGTQSGLLTDGVLVVRGDLSANTTMQATAPHRTRLLTGVGDTATITTGTGAFLFAALEVARPLRIVNAEPAVGGDLLVNYGGSITGPGRLFLNGTLTGTTGTLVAPSAVILHGILADTGTFRPDTTIFAGTGQVMPFLIGTAVPQYQAVGITGNVTLEGTGGVDSIAGPLVIGGVLNASSATPIDLRIGGDLTVTGANAHLVSNTAAHQLTVYGNATFAGDISAGDLSVGNLFVHGAFTQGGSTSAESFHPASTYETALVGDNTVSFDTPAQSRFGILTFASNGATRTLLSDVNVDGVLRLIADGGATVASSVLNGPGTRVLRANGADQGGTFTFRNVALSLQGAEPIAFTTTLTFADFDPAVDQFLIARDSGTVTIYDPVFNTVPNGGVNYLHVVDANAADGLPFTVEVNGTPTPAFHGGHAVADAPAVLNGWPESANFTWTGNAASTDWNAPANWASGIVPTAADSVFIPLGLLYVPQIPNGASVRAFVSERTEGVMNVMGTLQVAQRLVVPMTGGLYCEAGQVHLSNPSAQIIASGRISCTTTVLDGALVLRDTLELEGHSLVATNGAVIDVDGLAYVGGGLSTTSSGTLHMTDAIDSLHVAGNVSFGGGSTAGVLTAGQLTLGGNFAQTGDPAAFSASGNHETRFTTEGLQSISFANASGGAAFSHFMHLRVDQAPSSQIELANSAYVNGQLRETMGAQVLFSGQGGTTQTLTVRGAGLSGVTFDRVQFFIEDGESIDLLQALTFGTYGSADAQFVINRSGGSVVLDGITFSTAPDTSVGGRYLVVQDAAPLDGDTLTVTVVNPSPLSHNGAAVADPNAHLLGWPAIIGALWTGAVDGDFANPANWSGGVVPDLSMDVVIPPSGTPPILGDQRTVRSLNVNLGASLTINAGDTLSVTGAVDVQGSIASQVPNDSSITLRMRPLGTATLAATGEIGVRLTIASGTVLLTDSVRVAGGGGFQAFRVGVDVAGGTLDLNGHTLVDEGNFRTNGTGRVRMVNAADSLDIVQSAVFRGGDTDGLLTNGVMVVRGSLTQGADNSPTSFAASGSHLVRFIGFDQSADLGFDTPDSLSTGSHFARVAFDKEANLPTVQTMDFFVSPVFVRDIVSMNGPLVLSGGSLIVTGTIVQPPAGAYVQLDPSSSVTLTGVNQATCDGVQFEVTITPANFQPAACVPPPAIVWTGTATSDWNDPGNWAGGVVPVATDSVIVPAAATVTPDVPAATTIRVFENQSTLPVGTLGTITISERLITRRDAGGLSCSIGSVNFAATPAGKTATGLLDNCFTRVLGGTLIAIDTLRIQNADLQVENDAILDVGNRLVEVGFNFSTLDSGRVVMSAATSHMIVTNGASFGGGSTVGLLTAGVLSVGGNFTQGGGSNSAFAASGTHETEFTASTDQAVTMNDAGGQVNSSHFNHLRLSQQPGAALDLQSAITNAVGQLREGLPWGMRIRSAISGSLISEGADVDGIRFDNAVWTLSARAPVTQVSNVTFDSLPDTVIPFGVERDGGTVTVTNALFVVTPQAGFHYMVANDLDGNENGLLVVNMVGTTPNAHGGQVLEFGGATITGWGFSPPAPLMAWTGGAADGLWQSAGNWSLARAPQPGDSVVIDLNTNVTISTSSTIDWLMVGQTSAVNFTFVNGAILQVDSISFFGPTSTVNLNGGTFMGFGSSSQIINGAFHWNGGSLAGAGVTILNGTSDIATSGNVTLDDRNVSIAGTAVIGAFNIVTSASPTLSTLPGGTLTFQAPNTLLLLATVDIVNAGTMIVQPSGNTVRIDWPILNSGTIEVQSGTLDLRGGLNQGSGTIRVLDTSTLRTGGSFFNDSLVIADGGRVQLDFDAVVGGVHTFSALSHVAGGGRFDMTGGSTVTLQGAMDVDSVSVNNATVNFDGTDTTFVNYLRHPTGGAMHGTGIVAVRNEFQTGPNFSGSGAMVVQPGASMTLLGDISGWHVDVQGTLFWGDFSPSFNIDPIGGVQMAQVNVLNGGAFQIQHGATNRDIFGSALAQINVLNGGTIRKGTGTAISNFRQAMNIATGGVFQVLSGTINVQGTCTMNGTKTGPGSLTGNCGTF